MKTTETPDQLVQSSLVSQIEDFWSKDELTGALKKMGGGVIYSEF